MRSRLLRSIAAMLALALFAGCSGDDADADADAPGGGAARSRDARPSIVLVVIESLRTDAVASYGSDPSSPLPRDGRSVTPHLDGLAAEGVRHAFAFSDSPETVASHASLFTGLRVDRHGVGLFAEPIAPGSLAMIAEQLRDAGYQTAGFSENPMVGPDFGLEQGFEVFETPSPSQVATNVRERRGAATGFDVVEAARRWHARRNADVPFFLFVNLADPHLPLGPAAHPELLPEGTDETRVHNLLTGGDLRDAICRKLPDPESLEVLRGLYRSRVAEADAKLGRLLELARSETEPPLWIVTADHGTHLGERKLLGHHFDVDHRVLHVPLVVAGPGIAPQVESTPVALHRVADSIRCAAGDAAACATALPGATQTSGTSGASGGSDASGASSASDVVGAPDATTRAEPIVSIHPDDRAWLPPAAAVDTGSLVGNTHHGRVHCDRSEPVFGRAVSWIRFPMKLTWREGGRYQLFDLSWDPAERSDQLERQPAVAARLRGELDAFVAENGLTRATRRRIEGSLRQQAEASWDAARQAVLAAPRTEVDAVWFARLALERRPDPELESWVAGQIPLHEGEPYYPILVPTERSKQPLGEDPGRGIVRWTNYLLASVADPEPLAMRFLADYLALDTSGYILTHQLTALVWAEAMGRPVPEALRAKRARLLERIAAEQAADETFSDLWVERAAFLSAFGEPDRATLEGWVRKIVDNHLGGGDWGDGASELEFDGQALVAHHAREHLRGLAMVVLARYLEGA
jgi:arylsulfatase